MLATTPLQQVDANYSERVQGGPSAGSVSGREGKNKVTIADDKANAIFFLYLYYL